MKYESGFAHDETTDKIIELTLRIRFSLIILAKRFAHGLYANLFYILKLMLLAAAFMCHDV